MRYLIHIILSFFVRKDTPVLMASNANKFSLKNTVPAYAMAALPLITPVPIQDVQLFDYAVAHKSVNASYGIQANSNDTYIIGNDPYTSDQQRSRDQYEINDTDWNEVSFKEVNGSSTCKLALNNNWIEQNNYVVDGIVTMNLPEQGISGPFKITSIKHIIPQKKPVDEDESDDYEYRPVTGLFIHQSNDVWKIKFDNGTLLGVTNNHPIYSVSKGDWQHAGHLEIGEEVLAKGGNTKVVSKERDLTVQPVYNLEIKDLHNFLVGNDGVVVHNNYGVLESIVKTLKNVGKEFQVLFKCKEYANALRNHLIKKGVKDPITLVYRVYDQNGKRVICDLFHDGKKIAENGLHVGTPINGKMYDNLNPNGVDIDIWRNQFDYPYKGNGWTLKHDIIEATDNIEDFK